MSYAGSGSFGDCYDRFLTGFMQGAEISSYSGADEQWTGWSRQLDDEEHDPIVWGGFDSGREEGEKFRKWVAGNLI